ncbi:amidase [Ceratobasidium sp. AG-Ba]|nr:amidase [Ceratobasidium sp. AG-Ba]
MADFALAPSEFLLRCAAYILFDPPITVFPITGLGTVWKDRRACIACLAQWRTRYHPEDIHKSLLILDHGSKTRCIRKVWDEHQLVDHGGRGGKKCFGLMYDDGLVKPNPPVFRAMDMMKKALEAAGHEVIEWENCRHEDIHQPGKTHLLGRWGRGLSTGMRTKREPRIQTMDPALYSHELHPETNKGIDIIEQTGATERVSGSLDVDEIKNTTGRPVDAVISPAIPYAATPHGKNSSPFYTSLWNALDYATGVVPVTFVDPTLDRPVPPHGFYSDEDRTFTIYDTETYKDAPIGLQVVGQVQEEEAVLALMEEVDDALRQYKSR